MHKIAMLGAGLIGRFYTMSLQNYRGKDEIKVICSADPAEASKFAQEFNIARSTADMSEAIRDPEVDTVVIGLPFRRTGDPSTFGNSPDARSWPGCRGR